VIRLFDLLLSIIGLIILLPIASLIYFINLFYTNSPLFIQKRVGYKKKIFYLIKFRTMQKGTKSSATHLINKNRITSFGLILRKTKLDEIPQLLNVLLGDMSLVGPRPCLPNQRRLIVERERRGIFKTKPGITGLAQLSNIDMKDPYLLAKIDSMMVKKMNLLNYFYYIFKTIFFILEKKT